MGFRDSINTEFGIVKFLGDKKLATSGKRGELNAIVTEFLEENKLPVVRYNPKYKGYYDALNRNCETAQNHWDKFHQWVNKKSKANE